VSLVEEHQLHWGKDAC